MSGLWCWNSWTCFTWQLFCRSSHTFSSSKKCVLAQALYDCVRQFGIFPHFKANKFWLLLIDDQNQSYFEGWSRSQLTLGKRQGTPWTGCPQRQTTTHTHIYSVSHREKLCHWSQPLTVLNTAPMCPPPLKTQKILKCADTTFGIFASLHN